MVDTKTLTGGQVIVEMLKRFDVNMMFGLPGDQTDIYDALFHVPEIRHVLVRHEQAAAHMADAYARKTGKIGVCDASIGPGATNLISGIAEAHLSGIPVLAIASDVRSEWRGRECFQEIDQVSVFKHITKMSRLITSAESIPAVMAEAFETATSGRPGPVFLSFPIDVLKEIHKFDVDEFEVDTRFGAFPAHRLVSSLEQIADATGALLAAERPIILAGGGAVASGAMAEVQELAERFGMPVATTYMGKGIIAENHPLALGPFGLTGRSVTNEYVLQADLILAIGTRFTNVDTAAWRIPNSSTTMIQIDIEPTQIGRLYNVDFALPGDAKATLKALLVEADTEPSAKSQEQVVSEIAFDWRKDSGIKSALAVDSETAPIHPLQLIRALRNVMEPDDTIICDSGFNQIWGGQYFEVEKAGRNYIGPRGFGVMGFSLPAAIAHALARPEQRVVALCGDGGFAMVMQELETALRMGANITVCIMNNSNLQFIKDNQKMLFDSRFISTDFSQQNYAAIANAFGCLGIRVEDGADLECAIDRAIASDLPAVVDVVVDGSVTPERLSLQKLDA